MAATVPRLGICQAAFRFVLLVVMLRRPEDANDSPALAEPEEEVACKRFVGAPTQPAFHLQDCSPRAPASAPSFRLLETVCAQSCSYTQTSCSVSGLRPSAHVLKGTCAFHRTWRLAMVLSLKTSLVLHLQAELLCVRIQFGSLTLAKRQTCLQARRKGVLPSLQPNIMYNARGRA